MEKQYAIPIALGASILIAAAISTSFLPLQFASGIVLNKPANLAGAPPAIPRVCPNPTMPNQ
jgi:hypothetical protein